MNRINQGFEILIRNCADVLPNDTVLVISDSDTESLGATLATIAQTHAAAVRHHSISRLAIHGLEPPGWIADLMVQSTVIFCLTRMSLAHSKARFVACERGARFLSLPDFSVATLESAALRADFRGIERQATELASAFTRGSLIHLTTDAGTDLVMSIAGRQGNAAPGWCNGPGSLASPPDAEANVAVVEDATNGVVVVDGSIPHPRLGLLTEPLTLVIGSGRVQKILGLRSAVLEEIYALGGDGSRVVAEFGVGLNPHARLCGAMLEDEGTLGTAHLGMGSNATIGGANHVAFHLDHVIRDVNITVDARQIMRTGKIMF